MKHLLTLMGLFLVLSACERQATLFVGTYSDGFLAYDFDPVKGEVKEGPVAKAEMPNPSFLALGEGNRVYAVSEMPDSTAAVYAWRYLGNAFEFLNKEATGLPWHGEDPCYVAVRENLLAVANYSGGTLGVYKLKGDGSISPLDSLLYSGTGGPDMSRQDRPHVHCALFAPDGRLLFTEFSADAIGILDLTRDGVKNYRVAARLPADFGPRHLLLEGDRLYCIGELSGDIAVYSYPDMSLLQLVKADEANARGAADIHLSPDGKFLYASLRLQNDGLAIFSVAGDGTLTRVGYQHSGPHPRNFTVLEKWVLVACRDSDEIEIYRRNKKTGLLSDTGRRIQATKPVFVALQ